MAARGKWLPTTWDPGCGSVVASDLSTFEIPAEYACGDAGLRLCGDCIETAKASARDRYHEKGRGGKSLAFDYDSPAYSISDCYREAYFHLLWLQRREVIAQEAAQRAEDVGRRIRGRG